MLMVIFLLLLLFVPLIHLLRGVCDRGGGKHEEGMSAPVPPPLLGAGNNGESSDSGPHTWSPPDTRELSCVLAGGGDDDSTAKKYCVRDSNRKAASAALLKTVVDRCSAFVARLAREHPHHPVAVRLAERFEPERMMESLPNSEFTAHSENKGEKIALCLTPQKDAPSAQLIDDHTLTFVALHELAHVGTVSTEDHGDDFWRNFRYLLVCAKEQGVHEPMDYRSNPVLYCSMQINDNPFFSRKE